MTPPRSCDALGVCQRRAAPCEGCTHDTETRPPGGFWFAPGTIEAEPKRERWGVEEVVLAAVALSAAGGTVAGLLYVLLGGRV